MESMTEISETTLAREIDARLAGPVLEYFGERPLPVASPVSCVKCHMLCGTPEWPAMRDAEGRALCRPCRWMTYRYPKPNGELGGRITDGWWWIDPERMIVAVTVSEDGLAAPRALEAAGAKLVPKSSVPDPAWLDASSWYATGCFVRNTSQLWQSRGLGVRGAVCCLPIKGRVLSMPWGVWTEVVAAMRVALAACPEGWTPMGLLARAWRDMQESWFRGVFEDGGVQSVKPGRASRQRIAWAEMPEAVRAAMRSSVQHLLRVTPPGGDPLDLWAAVERMLRGVTASAEVASERRGARAEANGAKGRKKIDGGGRKGTQSRHARSTRSQRRLALAGKQ